MPSAAPIRFFRKAGGRPRSLGILAGTFNPVTLAHLALAKAAAPLLDEVVFVLPAVFPHKPYEGASFDERVAMLEKALGGQPAVSIASTEKGLFIDIARACHQVYGPDVELWFLCGRDAAERIVNWDYGEPGAFRKMLDEFGLLVANRQGCYQPAPEMADRIRELPVEEDYDEVSATRVREAAASGGPWEHLVPAAIAGEVGRIYAPAR